jgi:hypothetical protein
MGEMMAELVTDCPRCGANKISHVVVSSNSLGKFYGWMRVYELFCVCRNCSRATIYKVELSTDHSGLSDYYGKNNPAASGQSLNEHFNITGYVSLKDRVTVDAPQYLPANIEDAFNEAATCLSVQCWNASAAMLRLCIDLATKPMLPVEEVEGLNRRTRRDLGLRLPWLFDTGRLPGDLRELAKCIREDGNDGAHDGTLIKEDAEDLLDFSKVLLDRIFTEAERLRIAQERREARRIVRDQQR